MKTKFPFKLDRENTKRIINTSNDNLKKKLSQLWGPELLLNDYVIISEYYYRELRKLCTEEQNILFDDIFGKYSNEINLQDSSTFNNLEIFTKDIDKGSLIYIRAFGEFKNKSLLLNPCFNWEIKQDSTGSFCLILTKK